MNEDFYVDDCLSGGYNQEESNELATNLESVILKIGFQLKGFSFSGEPPLEHYQRTVNL